MKKARKFLVAVMVVAFCLSFASVAMAVDSPEGTDPVITDATAEQVSAVKEAIKEDANKQQIVQEVINDQEVLDKLGMTKEELQKVVEDKIANGDIVVKDIEIPEGATDVTVKLSDIGVSAKTGDLIIVIHYLEDGSIEVFYGINEDGTITFSPTGGSPFGFIVIAAGDETTTTTTTDSTTGSSTSPKTGDMDMMMVWLVIAVIATAATVVSAKKAKASK